MMTGENRDDSAGKGLVHFTLDDLGDRYVQRHLVDQDGSDLERGEDC